MRAHTRTVHLKCEWARQDLIGNWNFIDRRYAAVPMRVMHMIGVGLSIHAIYKSGIPSLKGLDLTCGDPVGENHPQHERQRERD